MLACYKFFADTAHQQCLCCAAAAMGLMPSGGGGSGSFGTPATSFGFESPPMNGFHGGPDRAQQRRMESAGQILSLLASGLTSGS